MSIALIGTGAIATFVQTHLASESISIAAVIGRPGKENVSANQVSSVDALPIDVDLLVDCAGHEALRHHGVAALRAGIDVITVSIGALADPTVEAEIASATLKGKSTLHLATGAIGALDALRAARIGGLSSVTYTGRKPPLGWVGSPAENSLDLHNLSKAETHFSGSAREAALAYPKNANVAAAVGLAALGLDKTGVKLIADPTISTNIHEIEATGAFGRLTFTIEGNSLANNPKTSALAAMSVVEKILTDRKSIRF